MCAEATFTLLYSSFSGLIPLVTGGCSPARAKLAPVCQWEPCPCSFGAIPWSLSGSFMAVHFLLFSPLPPAQGLRWVIAWGVLWLRNVGQLRAWSSGTTQGRRSSASLVQKKVKAWADNGEQCMAVTGSLTANFWMPYSMEGCIPPSLAPQDVCERCSQEYSSSPTGETLCYVKIAAFSPYLGGSWWRAWRQSGNSDGSHLAPVRAAYQQNAGADSRQDYLITYLLH